MHELSHFLHSIVKSYRKICLMLTVLYLFGSFSAAAQDFLVTVNYDTLNCKMGKMKDDFYPITFVMDDEKMTGLIHKDSVFFYKKNIFRGLDDNRLRPWYPLVEIGFDAGVAHQFGTFRIDDDLTDKNEFGARTGFHAGSDLTYYVSKQIGYGVKYNFRSLLGGDIRYQYVGPLMAFRFPKKNKPDHLFFSVSGGIGWMNQKNAPIQRDLVRTRIEMHAKAVTGDVTVGYHYKLSKHAAIRIKAGCNIGYPGFVRVADLTKLVQASDKPLELGNYCHNMNTFNLTAGFLFH